MPERPESPAHPNDPQQPLERPHSPSSVPRLRAKRSQTEITALGNLPNAVIREPVTSSVGQDVFSGIVRPLRLTFCFSTSANSST
jgi:hypothetical protein